MSEEKPRDKLRIEPVDLRAARVSLADLAYDRLVRALISQELKPGDRLYLDQLAESMGISKTPVKEALSRLSGEGLVRFSAGMGIHVTMPSADELTEMFAARLMCECYAVEEGLADAAAETLDRVADLAQLLEVIAGRPENDDWMARLQLDLDLHRTIIGLAGNRRILDWYDRLAVGIHSVRINFPRRGSRIPATLVEHAAIVAALRARDVAATKTALRGHILGVRDSVLEMLGNYAIGPREDAPEDAESRASAATT